MAKRKRIVLYTPKRVPERIEGTLSSDGKYIRYGLGYMRTARGLLTWAALSNQQKLETIERDYRIYRRNGDWLLAKDPGDDPDADRARWAAQGRAVYLACIRDMIPWPHDWRDLSRMIEKEYREAEDN